MSWDDFSTIIIFVKITSNLNAYDSRLIYWGFGVVSQSSCLNTLDVSTTVQQYTVRYNKLMHTKLLCDSGFNRD